MISVLVWKEYREHRIAWAALALVGAGTLLGLPAVLAPGGLEGYPDFRWHLCTTAVAVAWAYGMICGAMLLAGERESGTLPFLDALPGLRRQLWLAKWTAGVVLVLGQTALLMVLLAVGRLFDDGLEAATFLVVMVGGSLYGLAWGMLFSAFGRSVLNMILLALAAQLAASFFTLFLAAFLSGVVNVVNGAPSDLFMVVFAAGFALLTIPLVFACSAAAFTDLDRGRLRPGAVALPRKRRTQHAWSVLFWLAWRQARGFAAGMAVFALILGFLILPAGVVLWPIMTLLVGVLCGATVFADEQQGPFRFLGDQRLPLGKVWMVKVSLRFAIAAAAALVVLLPSFVSALGAAHPPERYPGQQAHFIAHLFSSGLLETVCPLLLFLTIWLVNGFCAGCLCGVLFRSGLASGVFGLFLGVLLSSVWVPSLLEGGLHAWQVFGPPITLLLATRLLLRPWAAGRIASWTTAYRLAPCLVLAVLWVAGGVGYRVLEIPDVAPKYDLAAFRASLPKPDENKAGDLVRYACLRFKELRKKLEDQTPRPAAMPGMAPGQPQPGAAPPLVLPPGQPPNDRPKPSLYERAADVATSGWPADDAELAAWLDKLFADDWVSMLKEAADLPPGMVENLRNENINSLDPVAQPAREIAALLRARGLQRQAAGDDGAYVENLRIGLGLARALRYHAPYLNVIVSRAVEGILVGGLDRWLEKLNGKPDLIRRALSLLSEYRDLTAEDEADQPLVDYLIARNTVDDAFYTLLRESASEESLRESDNALFRAQAQWVVLAGLVPWEHERQERTLRVLFCGTDQQRRNLATLQSPLLPLAVLREDSSQFPVRPEWQCRERAMQLKLALRWYQADEGKPAETLDQLLPKYLPAIPQDPYDGQPFRYRLSAGEEIEWPEDASPPVMQPPGEKAPDFALPRPAPPPPTRKIPPGQGVLWSVGPDKQDDGGRRQSGSTAGPNSPGEDLIFLVPLPATAK